MTWFKVDDGFWSHPKTLDLTNEAIALWVKAGSYSGQHLTDGVISRSALKAVRGTPEAARELVAAGLWVDHVDGWAFWDWEQYQPTKSKVRRDRAVNRERQERWRSKQKNDTTLIPVPTRPPYAVTNAVSNGVTPDGVPEPTPATADFVDALENIKRKAAQ